MLFAAASGQISVIEGLLVGAGVFLTGWVLTANARLIRAEHYSVASRTTVVRSAATAVTQIVLAPAELFHSPSNLLRRPFFFGPRPVISRTIGAR